MLLGPLTSVKEQATGRYAEAMARRGWVALSFDPRFFGASGGEPRQYESPPHKIADVRSAVSFLAEQPDVAAERIAAIGICAGGGYMAGAVAEEPRVRAFGTVAGFFHDAAKQAEWMGGTEKLEAAIARGREARHAWERTGVARTIPAVGTEGEVAMPLAEAFAYYGTPRGGSLGGYVNAFAEMSREQTLPFDAQSLAARIRVPTIMVHGERALSPALARSFYERLATSDKELHFLPSTGQIDFYDAPACIEPAADILDAALRARLARGERFG